MDNTKKSIIIYSDGACSGNPGPGGWGCVLLVKNENSEELQEIRLSGGEKLTTNNRMELMGAIGALEHVKKMGFSGCQSSQGELFGQGDLFSQEDSSSNCQISEIAFYTDSQYVKNGITTWIASWKKNGWKTSARQPVKNQDLWVKLDGLNSELNVNWCWVKGHAGNKYNEICDSLAVEESRKASL